ncbi:MAG: 2-C-methyl-D-erythritol 4-phosphate cytidylyltransferase [Nitrospiraceae bacterium]
MSRREAKGPVTGPKTVALVPAAGRGLRMGGHIPKQFLLLGGLPILAHSLRALQDSPVIHEIILAVPEAERRNCLDRIVSPGHFTKVTKVVSGGEQRQDSVRHALAEVDAETEFVLVHDAVRPFLTQAMIREVVAAAQQHGGAIIALPMRDTVKHVGRGHIIERTVDRRPSQRRRPPAARRTGWMRGIARRNWKGSTRPMMPTWSS